MFMLEQLDYVSPEGFQKLMNGDNHIFCIITTSVTITSYNIEDPFEEKQIFKLISMC